MKGIEPSKLTNTGIKHLEKSGTERSDLQNGHIHRTNICRSDQSAWPVLINA